MGYIPKRTYETAEIPEAIVKEIKYIKPILKKTTKRFPNNDTKHRHDYLLYILIFILLCMLFT